MEEEKTGNNHTVTGSKTKQNNKYNSREVRQVCNILHGQFIMYIYFGEFEIIW